MKLKVNEGSPACVCTACSAVDVQLTPFPLMDTLNLHFNMKPLKQQLVLD